jgi:DNA repair protein SbcC/Rad50
MRILGIRFKNINSLAGEWAVDFTDPAYSADGIFAITGPTGAGKTTLLDVICLALYGRTPRLERINKSGNDIMTRQTGECFAEVTFSTPEGNFRCHWSQHKARKKPDGDLQTPRHEISNADTGQVIDNQIRTVAQRIVTVTGMDFVRFTQSMMLAQGGFAAFLKANADERAPILEQITGTGIYSEISIRVHERHRQETSTLDTLEAELRGLALLTPEQESALLDEQNNRSAELEQQLKQLHQQQTLYSWKSRCIELETKQLALHTELNDWQQQLAAFQPEQGQLAKAQRTLELAADYSALLSLRQTLRDDENSLQQTREQLPAAEQLAAHHLKQCELAQAARDRLSANLAERRPIWRQVIQLDTEISQQKKSVLSCREKFSSLQTQIEEQQHRAQALARTQADTRIDLDRQRQTPDESDSSLLSRFEHDLINKTQAVETQKEQIQTQLQGLSIKHWREKANAIDHQMRALDKIVELQLTQNTLHQQHNDLVTGKELLTSQLLQLTDKIAHQHSLSQAHEKTLASLRQQLLLENLVLSMEAQRTQLTDGEHCPLCGATEHPWAIHAPDQDIDQTTQQILSAEKTLDDCRRQLQSLLTEQSQLQERCALNDAQQQRLQQQLEQSTQRIQQLAQEYALDHTALDNQRTQLMEQLQVVKTTLDTIEVEQTLLASLEETLRTAVEQKNQLQHKINAANNIKSQLQTVQEGLTRLYADQKQLSAELETGSNSLAETTAQRRQLLGEHNPLEQETTFEKELASAENSLQSAQSAQQQSARQLHEKQQTISQLQKNIAACSEKIAQAEIEFSHSLQRHNFNNEQDYLSSRLPDELRQHLSAKANQLQQTGTRLNALLHQVDTELNSLKNQALTDASLDTIKASLDEQQQRTDQQRELLGGIRRELEANRQAREKQGEQATRIDAQKLELARWAALHELIGSADGKKFRNFAQGLTFELMIQHANVQLSRMTERYLLVRDNEQPLDLNVIDQYQAGEIRSTRNLSGGESFIVSLALALGLSAMASRNVRVDSLFLDEGFGTLDEDALDVALDTLGSLQQQGKLIGVISHVSALKERIATQITVIPGPGGRARISGPGCFSIGTADTLIPAIMLPSAD